VTRLSFSPLLAKGKPHARSPRSPKVAAPPPGGRPLIDVPPSYRPEARCADRTVLVRVDPKPKRGSVGAWAGADVCWRWSSSGRGSGAVHAGPAGPHAKLPVTEPSLGPSGENAAPVPVETRIGPLVPTPIEKDRARRDGCLTGRSVDAPQGYRARLAQGGAGQANRRGSRTRNPPPEKKIGEINTSGFTCFAARGSCKALRARCAPPTTTRVEYY